MSLGLLFEISIRSQLKFKKLEFSRITKSVSALRSLSLNRPKNHPLEGNNDETQKLTFKEIYRFPYIRLGYAINKLKWPQTLLSAAVVSTTTALYVGGIIDVDVLMGVSLSAGFFTGGIYAYGSIFHEAVGFISLSEDGLTLKISYLDFWGDRVDKQVPVDDVIPFSDRLSSPFDFAYFTIQFYSSDKLQPKLFLKGGGKVTDEERFIRVFGDYTK